MHPSDGRLHQFINQIEPVMINQRRNDQFLRKTYNEPSKQIIKIPNPQTAKKSYEGSDLSPTTEKL